MENHGEIGRAGRLSNMDRKTARRYIREGKLPSELKKPRTWRTRKDPFEEDWPTIVGMLRDAPELEGKALFEWLCEQKPGSIDNGQLRTFQRKVRRWRSQEGPAKEVIFPQSHRPGEAMQTDFTWLTELEITIAGEALAHMLCHSTLPFSNWRWGTVCYSESLEALKRGVQAAFFRLGHVPEFEQTDNSTSDAHSPGKGDAGDNDNGQGRRFNTGYLRFLERCELTVERLRGSGRHRMNYRHIIDSLVRKPGAFERYRYREALFPSLVSRAPSWTSRWHSCSNWSWWLTVPGVRAFRTESGSWQVLPVPQAKPQPMRGQMTGLGEILGRIGLERPAVG